jgi:hypothetical protein
VQAISLVKTVEVAHPDRKQTLLILPQDYVKRGSPDHVVQFKTLDRTNMLMSLLGPHDRAYDKTYRLVENNGSWHVSIPRAWLRNIGARHGDRIDVFTTSDPAFLVLQLRKVI